MAQLDPRAFDSRIDFSTIMQGLDSYQRGMKESRDYEGNQKVGGALASNDYGTAMALAGQYGMQPSMLMQLAERQRVDTERRKQEEALANPEVMRGLPASYAASLQALAPEQRASALVQAQSPMTAAQLAASRTSTALHGQQLQTAQATAPYEIDLKRLQAANAQREYDAPKDNLQKLKDDETLYRVNPRTGAVEQIAGQQGGGAGTEFNRASGKQLAETYQGYLGEGQKAVSSLSDLQRMQDLSGVIGSGKFASWLPTVGPWLTSIGLDPRGLSEAQAFQAIANKMAPAMRPSGSGATSDRDMSIFMSSLPQLSQTPQGRALVIQQMKAFHDYNRNRSMIASQALTGRMRPQDAETAINSLPSPFELMKQSNGGGESSLPPGWSIQRVK